MAKKSAGKITRQEGQYEYEIGGTGNKNLFDLPRAKQERKQQLRHFVLTECAKAWAVQDNRLTTLKKAYLSDMLDSL